MEKGKWRTGMIETSFGSNRTGVYSCVKEVLLQVIKEGGGLDCIEDFGLKMKDGVHVYSHPRNGRVLENYSLERAGKGKSVLVDV